MKRFLVVLPREDGGIEVYPMKEWLRQHPEHLPPGLDATSSTSHQLRNALKKCGWLVQETSDEVRLIMPSSPGAEQTIGVILGEESEQEEGEIAVPFALEHQLRDFISQNLHTISIEGKQLRLYVDPTGRDGIEFPTAVGPIDILAVDDSGAFVVFELKRSHSPDKAIGQLARYMGWVKHTIGRDREVRGVIIAEKVDDKLRYAASVIPNVSLFEYEVKFRIKPASQIQQEDNVLLSR